ncbi:MAG: FMN-binding negative transcriptional regulator [Vulcanimicrobiaceae bacterium]
MYVPPHFACDDAALMAETIGRYPLATLVTCGERGLVANHVPLTFEARDRDRADGDGTCVGALHGHLSRANEQWREIASGTGVLAIFNGSDAYVSPSAYETKLETGKVVPTWNYVVVHAYGTGRTFDDPERLHALVSALTDRHEAPRNQRWRVTDAPASYVDGQLRGIVGIEIDISRMIGKWKISQNRSKADRDGAIDDLARSERAAARDLAAIMAQADAPPA